jgi:hypothetical protein
MPPLPAPRTHLVGEAEALGAFLRERRLARLERIFSERGLRQGEWLAEHATAQLSSASACTSKPQWVAWCAAMAGAPSSSDTAASADLEASGSAARIVVLWAEDARAARRAVLALQLRRACPVLVLMQRAFLEHLERCACEAESGAIDWAVHHPAAASPQLRDARSDQDAGGDETGSGRNAPESNGSGTGTGTPWAAGLLADGSPLPQGIQLPAGDFEAWGSLFEVHDQALAELRARRAADAEADAAATRRKVSELSAMLLALDPDATVEAEPEGEGQAGRHGLVVQGCLDGHPVCWGGTIDRFAVVAEVLRAIRASCGCC